MLGNRRTSGFTLTELVVASSLLISLMAVVAPLTIHSTQLWRDTRHHQLALDEVSNQIEYLSALNDSERTQAIAALAPSSEFQSTLPSAEIQATTETDKDGEKLVMTVKWQRRSGQSRTVTLVGWLDSGPRSAETEESAR